MQIEDITPGPRGQRGVKTVRRDAAPTGIGDFQPDDVPPADTSDHPGGPAGPATTATPATEVPAEPATVDQIREWLSIFVEPYQVVEIRIPQPFRGRVQSRLFRGPEEAARYAARWSGKAKAVYFTLNPLSPDKTEGSACARDVLERRWLFVDFDPIRAKGFGTDSATAVERRRARVVAVQARAWLRSLGFPDPVLCDSGNGFHLLYQIWLPNDDASKALIAGVLKALAARFDTDDVKVDTGLFDANRIDKVYGTQACKGPGTTERPHRSSRVLQVPDAIEPVATALLEELAAESKALDLEAEIARTPAAHAAGDGAGGPPVPAGANGRPKANGSSWVGTTVADDYRARGPDWGEILEGWTLTATLPDGERRWTRPGKDGADGISATTGHAGQDCFHVFSDQAKPFAPNESYSKFQAYALLNHGGDESQAAAELYKAGYGTRQPPPSPTDDDRPGWHKDGAAFLDDGPPHGHAGACANGRAVTRRREPGDDDERGDAAPVGDAHGAADRLKRLKPTEGVVEAPDDPHKLARTYVAERYAHPDHPRLVYYNEDFHEYRDGCYRRMPDGDADVELTAAIKREFDRLYFEDLEAYRRALVAHQIAMKNGGDWEGSKPVPPKARKVKTGVFNDTRRALRSVVGVPHTYQQPCWLTPSPDAPPPRAVLPARNALVDLSSASIGADGTIDLHAVKVLDPTPAFFSPITLHYPFDPDAPDPTRWLTFLEEVFPGDAETRRELQKWFGYLITMDTKQQKMLYLIGRSRSGKGTVVRVLTDLVGQLNCASPALMDLAEPFGLSNLPGKTLMTITDARISKDDKELARLQERLLKISGEDLSQINRKNKPIIEMKLLTRVVIASNEVPAFRDPSGAFKERMRPLRFQVSFAGKEDPDLFGKLRAEMGGILNWAIKGQALLVADGGFLVPRSARGLVRSLQEAATPLHVFLDDCCTTDKDATVTKDDLFLVYQWWCLRTANRVTPIQTFGKELPIANPEIKPVRLRPRERTGAVDPFEPAGMGQRGETRQQAWKGIKFRPDVLEQAREAQRRKEERFQPRDWSSR